MSLMILLFLAALPVILICRYIYMKDRNKESSGLLTKLFMCGILSCFLVLIISGILFIFIPSFNKDIETMRFIEALIYAFIGVALIEESCKWLMVYKIGYNNKEFDEIYDMIVYAVFVSLGFAFFENVLYVLGKENVIAGIATGISRALLAVPGHAWNAVFMGYYLCLAKLYSKQGKKDLEKKNIYKSIVIPTILHGIYDFCLFANVEVFIMIFFVFVITMYIISIKKVKEVAQITNRTPQPQPQLQPIPITPPTNNFCPVCGTKVIGNFCTNCGTRQA